MGISLINKTKQVKVSINSDQINPDNLPGIQTGSVPWVAETDYLKERLAAIGLPVLSSEGTILHTHEHLDIFVSGKQLTIPQDIGINESGQFFSPIHTHDTTGIIHVESPVIQTFTLGQFFDIWGVRLTDKCIGGYCGSNTMTLRIYVNGKAVTSNFRNLVLSAHQEIVIAYGTDSQLPSSIPSSYNFPPDY
jgi:hypothetical protein